MANAFRPSARARASRIPRAYAVCVAVALLAGCGRVSALEAGSPHVTTGFGVVAINPGSDPTNTPLDRLPSDFRVERRTWGGMCASGPCESTFTVVADGTWVMVVNGTRTTGTFTHKQVMALSYDLRVTQALLEHVRATQLSTDSTAHCAADHDGTSVAYAWTIAGATRSISSCDGRPLPFDDVAVAMDRLADSVSH